MTRYRICLSVLVFMFTLGSYSQEATGIETKNSQKRPNILLVVADDLGMFDIGAFGGEIRTPNIDLLANRGLKFTNFYTSATCSPTRSMLLSGVDSHDAGLGNMVEHVAPNQKGRPGYEGYLSHRVVSVATMLKRAGYRTYMAGKWHLGKGQNQLPYDRGFDESFALMQGGASYFNDMMGLNAVVPKAYYRRNDQVVETLPGDFYASEYYADFMIEQIQHGLLQEQPFFGYLAFSAPHWPLQVRDEHIGLYQGQYDKGYDVLKSQRISSAKNKGVIPKGVRPSERPSYVKAWDELNLSEQKKQAKTMEIYAAVVERMDFHMGRVLEYLETIGELDNTLIIFMSDNGADGSNRSNLPGNDKWLPEAWDLSYENMGKIGSYVYPGGGWAAASVGPFNMRKEFLSEGGIRAPLIIAHPKLVSRNTQTDNFLTVKDITPTILEYASAEHPGREYQGRQLTPITGVSMKPFLTGVSESIHKENTVTGWELFGQKAIRQGDWKLLWLSSKPRWIVTAKNSDQWQLFNVKLDPGETNNLADKEPEKLEQMIQLWQEYSEQKKIVLPDWQ